MKRVRTCRAGIILCAALLATGCSQKSLYKGDIRDADLVPTKYPQSALRAGALGWGHPRDVPENVRPAEQNLSEELLANIPKSDAAWFSTNSEYNVYLGAVAEPGTSAQILENLRIMDGEAAAEIEKGGMKFVDWGEMQEENIDFQRLSDAIVRGWYNMPGQTMKFEALAALRPDKTEHENRPWVIRRSITANGMKYDVSSELGTHLAARAEQQFYMSGEAKGGFTIENGTSMKINKPMVVGYDTAELISIEPPLPLLVSSISPDDMEKHVFVWKSREARNRNEIEVEPKILKTQAKREAADAVLPAEVVTQVEKAMSSADPVGISVTAAVKNVKGGNWESIGEGDIFYSDELVKLKINLQEPGYLYIATKDSDGDAAVLYPTMDGHSLSRGQNRQLPAGSFNFPGDVVEFEGMEYESEPQGTESFIIVATREKNDAVALALSAFVDSMNKTKSTNQARTRGVSFPSSRIPTGFANAATASGDQKEVPVFSGVDGATVVTLNMTRKPVE